MATAGSVYVHYPFCLSKCSYCDFVSYPKPDDDSIDRAYADAVTCELRARRKYAGFSDVSSIYFGGGTPSLWGCDGVARVIDSIRSLFAVDANCEVTLECNPSSVENARMKDFVDAGVNRFSLGIQSLEHQRLLWLKRPHDSRAAIDAIHTALTHTANVSVDYLYGVPGQTEADIRTEMSTLCHLGVPHVSAYSLTVEERTSLATLVKLGRAKMPDEDVTVAHFLAVLDTLAAFGIAQYEISNYSKRGSESRHNCGYWAGRCYLGVGVAAVSTIPASEFDTLRIANLKDPLEYVARARNWQQWQHESASFEGDFASRELEPLDIKTRVRERLFLGLRLTNGVDVVEIARDLGVPMEAVWTPARQNAAEKLASMGSLCVEGSRIFVPKAMRLLTDGITEKIL